MPSTRVSRNVTRSNISRQRYVITKKKHRVERTFDVEVSAALHARTNSVAAALAGEFDIILGTVELTVRPDRQIPYECRLDALEVVGPWVRRMINVRHVVSIRFREVHGNVIPQPGNIADRGALDPTRDVHVRRIVDTTAIRVQLLNERRGR